MIWLLCAIAWGVAAYWWDTGRALPERRALDPEKVRKSRSNPRADTWSITARARKMLGWSPARFRMLSWVWALGVGMVWLLLVQSPVAALVMAWVGWQLPAWWLETRSAKGLAKLHRQFAELVSLIHDQLHSQGSTVETALTAASSTFTEEPLGPMLADYRRSAGGGMPLHQRLDRLQAHLDLPTADFFFQLLRLRDQTGTEDITHAFDSLVEKLQDDEQVQAMIQGEVRTHSLFLVLGFLVNLLALPVYRFWGANWTIIHHQLHILISGSAILTAIIFLGIRRFTRAQLHVGTAV